jgi:hypothetical protein
VSLFKLSVAALATIALLAVPTTAVASSPSASISKSCSVSKKPRALGPTYTLGLSVKGTSCANGRGFVRAYYKCRGGGKGRCRRRVSGYRCSEKRSNVIRTQFDARVTCKKGGRRIVHKYTQFT